MKVGLDRASPVIETLGLALAAVEESKKDASRETIKLWTKFNTRLKTILANKRGENEIFGVAGNMLDAPVRFVLAMMSMAHIAFNAAVQLTSPVGEAISAAPLIGNRGAARFAKRAALNPRKLAEIFNRYEYITGKGPITEIFEPGRSIDKRFWSTAYSVMHLGRITVMRAFIIASMTNAEFEAGELSADRLVDLQLLAARWTDQIGMRSVIGSHSWGQAFTKYRGWVIPILRTTLQDISSLLNSLGEKTPVGGKILKGAGYVVGLGNEKTLTRQQAFELIRIVETAAVVSLVSSHVAKINVDDDSYEAKLKRKLLSEMSTLTAYFNPQLVLSLGFFVNYVTRLFAVMDLFLRMERYKPGSEHAGELKAPRAAAKLVPGAAAVGTLQAAFDAVTGKKKGAKTRRRRRRRQQETEE